YSRSPTAAAPGGHWIGRCAPRFPRIRQARPAAASRARDAAPAPLLVSRLPPAPGPVPRPRSWRQETRRSLPMQYRQCPCAEGRAGRASVRGRDVAIVDEAVDRLLDVDARTDHARLLQGDACFEDRFPLRQADLVVGELGALLELLVDDVVRELGDGDEGLLELVVVGERI